MITLLKIILGFLIFGLATYIQDAIFRVIMKNKLDIPKIYRLFPLKFGIRKVYEKKLYSDRKPANKNHGILYSFYALDLFVVTLPFTITKWKY